MRKHTHFYGCSFHSKQATPAMQNHICWCDSDKGIMQLGAA
ncbi:hypothetical protein [Persicirhabdus sediminis]|nr:hypothetical protein [Persicirhabdus sediminis]